MHSVGLVVSSMSMGLMMTYRRGGSDRCLWGRHACDIYGIGITIDIDFF